jgi:hydrogenase maturation protease
VTWPFVVGLGSHHGDDQAGWLALDRLRDRGYPLDRLFRARHPADILDAVDSETRLVVCDACVGNDEPGTIRRFRWPSDQIVYQRPAGSHDLSLRDVMQLGQNLQCVPDVAEIWTLEGSEWTAGADPSFQVRAAAVEMADAIWKRHRNA